MQKSPNVAALAVMVNATHHQRGAGCSTTPEIRSVSQLKLRLFNTSGTRVIRLSASLIGPVAVGAASIIILQAPPLLWPRRWGRSGQDLPQVPGYNLRSSVSF